MPHLRRFSEEPALNAAEGQETMLLKAEGLWNPNPKRSAAEIPGLRKTAKTDAASVCTVAEPKFGNSAADYSAQPAKSASRQVREKWGTRRPTISVSHFEFQGNRHPVTAQTAATNASKI
jgi:hypothetical protein